MCGNRWSCFIIYWNKSQVSFNKLYSINVHNVSNLHFVYPYLWYYILPNYTYLLKKHFSLNMLNRSCHFCAMLNGIVGCLVLAAPPLVANDWFPPNERTTALGKFINFKWHFFTIKSFSQFPIQQG